MIDPIKTLLDLIAIPSFSKEETGTADYLGQLLEAHEIGYERHGNNLVSRQERNPAWPWIMLCSHHDTVRPNAGYTRDPFAGAEESGKIYGLGSNDAGASLVSLLAVFQSLADVQLPYNLLLALVAEEEISGAGGVAMLKDILPSIHLGIIGEPTDGGAAVAEKGLMVIDAEAHGPAGHAAHHQGESAIDIACGDIDNIHRHVFARVSPELGLTKATVTRISAGEKHNQVPAVCHFTIDVRTNELSTNEEIYQELQSICRSRLTPRSFRLQPSRIDRSHPFVQLLIQRGTRLYGSPTLSDQALLPFPTIKWGPGQSRRSHTADEYVLREEIESGIASYLDVLKQYKPT